MKYNTLGSSDLLVSEVCLGTMTYGLQNTEQDAHDQLDYAISRGVNFIDTAEVYPVPLTAPGHVPGTSERYIGTYLAKHPGVREKLIIATKVVGYKENCRPVAFRTDPPSDPPYPTSRLDAASIKSACAASLRRLQTTYIDLYQLHFPDRYVPSFGKREYKQSLERESVPFSETLLALKELLDAGKIRAYGLSNETTFGVCAFVRAADALGMPRPATIQNSFCLVNRQFEVELAEACAPRNFNIGLLPWSILAGGLLTGKYQRLREDDYGKDDLIKDGLGKCRFVKFWNYMPRFQSGVALDAAQRYTDLAKVHGMSAATMAQAFCKSRWYIPSSIIGATTVEQLKENIDAFDVELSEEVLKQIDEIHNMNKDVTQSV